MSQATRYSSLCQLANKGHLDNDHKAAFFLLSCDKEVHAVASRFVSSVGVDFDGLKHCTSGFDERIRLVIDIAHNLFSYNSPCAATPFEISRLGYPLMGQVCNALRIAADEVNLEIKQDRDNNDVLEFDDTPYQKAKSTYSFFKYLQNGVAEDVRQDMTGNDAVEKVKTSIADRLEAAKVEISERDAEPQASAKNRSAGHDR